MDASSLIDARRQYMFLVVIVIIHRTALLHTKIHQIILALNFRFIYNIDPA